MSFKSDFCKNIVMKKMPQSGRQNGVLSLLRPELFVYKVLVTVITYAKKSALNI